MPNRSISVGTLIREGGHYSDDGQCLPKHVVFIISNKHKLDIHCCVIDLITLHINYYTQCVWHIPKSIQFLHQTLCVRMTADICSLTVHHTHCDWTDGRRCSDWGTGYREIVTGLTVWGAVTGVLATKRLWLDWR